MGVSTLIFNLKGRGGLEKIGRNKNNSLLNGEFVWEGSTFCEVWDGDFLLEKSQLSSLGPSLCRVDAHRIFQLGWKNFHLGMLGCPAGTKGINGLFQTPI